MGILRARIWVKEGPNQLDLRIQLCLVPNITGIPRIKSQKFRTVYYDSTWAQNGHSMGPEMGEGGPGPNFAIHLILSGAQNYGDSNHKSRTFRKFLLIDQFGPKLGVLEAQK